MEIKEECPRCKSWNFIREKGWYVCYSCGYKQPIMTKYSMGIQRKILKRIEQ